MIISYIFSQLIIIITKIILLTSLIFTKNDGLIILNFLLEIPLISYVLFQNMNKYIDELREIHYHEQNNNNDLIDYIKLLLCFFTLIRGNLFDSVLIQFIYDLSTLFIIL